MKIRRELLNDDWRLLEDRIARVRRLSAKHANVPPLFMLYRGWDEKVQERERLERNFQEIENIITRMLHVCCPTCFLKIPFPRPYDERLGLIEWQLRADLREIERAVNDIDNCMFAEPAYRMAGAGRFPLPSTATYLTIADLDPNTLLFTTLWFQNFGGPPTGDGGRWGSWAEGKRKIVGYDHALNYPGGPDVLFVLDTSDDDPLNWTRTDIAIPSEITGTIGPQFYFTGPDGRYLVYTALVSGKTKLFVHDSTTSYSYTITAYDDVVTDGPLTGSIVEVFFSPNGRFIAMTLDGDQGYDFVRVYDRFDGSVVYSQLGPIPSRFEFSRDSAYFWHNSYTGAPDPRDIRVLETSGWTVVASSALNYTLVGGLETNPHILALDPTNTYWVGQTSDFPSDTTKLTVYNFNFSVYHANAVSGAFGDQGPIDWTSDGLYLIRANNNITTGGISLYKPSTMMASLISGPFGTGVEQLQNRSFYNNDDHR